MVDVARRCQVLYLDPRQTGELSILEQVALRPLGNVLLVCSLQGRGRLETIAHRIHNSTTMNLPDTVLAPKVMWLSD
jgi:hypothetical protein